ncbi:hypothetical protein BN140_2097 [Methanoculleus bourgensis MS2]|uniref:Uncharacterized protein n=1 Tax=Methanoculleus bourgensis (strain ATCC 43281 / DSM 3045 / OCM 15 / MS2) TaxID=1201294 RepID=I7L0T4_METBM|nr:hypothetical protein BN140_2097 [Methanoculleus bourgensis MS2]
MATPFGVGRLTSTPAKNRDKNTILVAGPEKAPLRGRTVAIARRIQKALIRGTTINSSYTTSSPAGRVNIEHLLDHPRVTFIEGSTIRCDSFPGAGGIFHQTAIPSVFRAIGSPLHPRPWAQRLHARAHAASRGIGARCRCGGCRPRPLGGPGDVAGRRPGSRGTSRGCSPALTQWWSLPGTRSTGGLSPRG